MLASEGDGQGWYEAIMAEIRGEGVMVPRWRDWPDQAEFLRSADGIVLLPKPVDDAA